MSSECKRSGAEPHGELRAASCLARTHGLSKSCHPWRVPKEVGCCATFCVTLPDSMASHVRTFLGASEACRFLGSCRQGMRSQTTQWPRFPMPPKAFDACASGQASPPTATRRKGLGLAPASLWDSESLAYGPRSRSRPTARRPSAKSRIQGPTLGQTLRAFFAPGRGGALRIQKPEPSSEPH